jgi:hypothetical protein
MKENLEICIPYNKEHEKKEKSANELSDFFLKNLEKKGFLIFLKDSGIFTGTIPFEDENEADKNQIESWGDRLEKIFEKAVSRQEHQIDRQELTKMAIDKIIKLKDSGEIPPSNYLNFFYQKIS